ncbi:MAG: oxygen-independent coproporphyrinogen III oxidase [Imperialibacter sp.]|uniref:oxygen-independent coproporphyrinogen III oxidase n=1 Tax=Imperialibacter sp. TaxID=2038411 RepID=UPI0032EC803A
MQQQSSLLSKYNIPGPRYTSYPTVPYWESDDFTCKQWTRSFQQAFAETTDEEGISLYIHLPYCESLCTFCGCNKRITKNHGVETPYISTVLKEWDLYVARLPKKPVIKEIHLGGGTPTFFSPVSLQWLIIGILSKAHKHPKASFSFEGHPNNTSYEHLKTLRELGFNRVSYGIQDFDPIVQEAIHRHQTFDKVKQVTEWSRQLGYTSINYDLVYGLPFQTSNSIIDTIEKVKELKPDRIAFYSYAHVPWIKGNGQRKFSEADLPKDDEKRALYELGRDMLLDIGLVEIGMDHFATKQDELYESSINGQLHRNFMGYTASSTKLLIGLGVSSISDSWYGFAQNHKDIETYQESVESGFLPVFRGHMLNQEDLIIRQHILDLMCRFSTTLLEAQMPYRSILERLAEPLQDELIELRGDNVHITEKGRAFIRNICMAFDKRLWRKQPETQLFSSTI